MADVATTPRAKTEAMEEWLSVMILPERHQRFAVSVLDPQTSPCVRRTYMSFSFVQVQLGSSTAFCPWTQKALES